LQPNPGSDRLFFIKNTTIAETIFLSGIKIFQDPDHVHAVWGAKSREYIPLNLFHDRANSTTTDLEGGYE
jgi:hypothetical protein